MFISKLTEKCVLEQLSTHFEMHDLLPDYQSAYRPGFSTETAILRLHHDLLLNMELQQVTSFIGVDLSAAFDTVHHGILLSVLENSFGVCDNALKWFDSYLSDKSFVVNVNGICSNTKRLTSSVLQGSILGPVLFNAYSSTFGNCITDTDTEILGYADDHGLHKSFDPRITQNENITISSMENCMLDVHKWMNENRLKMNPTKTEFIYFGSRQMIAKCQIECLNVLGDIIQRSDVIRCLGVWLDSQLSFVHHINQKCKVAY